MSQGEPTPDRNDDVTDRAPSIGPGRLRHLVGPLFSAVLVILALQWVAIGQPAFGSVAHSAMGVTALVTFVIVVRGLRPRRRTRRQGIRRRS